MSIIICKGTHYSPLFVYLQPYLTKVDSRHDSTNHASMFLDEPSGIKQQKSHKKWWISLLFFFHTLRIRGKFVILPSIALLHSANSRQFMCVVAGFNAAELTPKYPDFIKERVYALYDAVYWWNEYGSECLKSNEKLLKKKKDTKWKFLSHFACWYE